MFKFLRSNAKYFYWVIAATFVAFIFLAWGMDFAGGGSGSGRRSDTVGSINGVAISAWSYDRAVQEIQAGMRRQNPDRALTANQVALAREQAWDQLLREQILAAEVRRLGLTVSDQELVRIFRENPPPEILAAFVGEDGEPDLQAYYNALGNRESGINWPQVEQWVRQSVPRQKLLHMLTAGVAVSEQEIRHLYRQQTERAVAEYMGVALAELAPDYAPTDEQIEAYYADHAGEFMQAAQGQAKIVAWEVLPAPADFDDVREAALEIKAEIDAGVRTFVEAAAVYSEDSTADSGGDLGTFDRNRMVAPFTEAAFALPVGKLSDPIQTQFGFHLVEVLEQEIADGEVARIHARHILLRVTPSESTREAIIEHARQFRRQVTTASFLQAADRDTTCKVFNPPPFSEGRDFPGLRQSAAGNRWVFRAKAGQISPLFFTDDHVYVVLAEGVQPAGPQPLDRVRGQIELSLKRQEQRRLAAAMLSPAVGKVQLGATMAVAAAEYGLLHAVTDTIDASSNIGDVGYATAFNQVALQAPVGQLVPEVATNRGVFALRVLWQKPFDAEDYAARRDELYTMLLQNKQSVALEEWLQARIAEAKIQDQRDDFLAEL
jgi:peptidyl-prolyl cis-trans isomerase D